MVHVLGVYSQDVFCQFSPSMALTFISHSSCVDASHLCSVACSVCTVDHCSWTNYFHSFSTCVIDSDDWDGIQIISTLWLLISLSWQGHGKWECLLSPCHILVIIQSAINLWVDGKYRPGKKIGSGSFGVHIWCPYYCECTFFGKSDHMKWIFLTGACGVANLRVRACHIE